MRILQVCAKFHPYVASGSTKVAYHISKELAKRGHSVTVYTSNMKDKYNRIINGDGVEELDGIHVRRFKTVAISATREMKFFITPTLIKMSKEEIRSFDIIHLHEYTTFQNIIIHHYARKYGVPYVLQAHGSLPRIGAWRRLKWLYDVFFGYRLLRDAAKVIALGRIEAEQYRRMGVPEEKIAIIPNGIDLSEYANLPPKGCFKKKFGIKEEEKIVLYLGRIHRGKGIDFLIKSFAYLVKNGMENVKLVIAGPDDGYLNEAKSLVDSLGLGDRVLFTGMLHEADKISAYVDADIVVNVEPKNVFGLVPLESAACSTPVIVSIDNAIRNIIRQGKFGFSVKSDDIYELAETMRKMLNDNDLLREMGQKGRRFVFENYNWANIITKLEKVYDEVVVYAK